jgi:O-antigen ligase
MAISARANRTRVVPPEVTPFGSSGPFWVVILFLVLEFARPQELFPALGALHLPGIVAAILACLMCVAKRASLSDPETKLFIALLALMPLHVPFALNSGWAFHIARVMLTSFVAYLGIVTFVDTVPRFRTLISIWLAIHVFQAIYGISQLDSVTGAVIETSAGSAQGVTGGGYVLGEENAFATGLNMILPFAFFAGLAEPSTRRRLLYAGLAALFAFASILTFSRSGFVGLLAVGFCCWLRSPRKVVSMTLLVILAVLLASLAPEAYWEEMRSISQGTSDPTGRQRLHLWQIGLVMFRENPIMGVGQGNFAAEFRDYELASGFDRGLDGKSHALVAHSDYITLLSELGLVGAVLWAGIVWCALRNGRLVRRTGACRTQPARPPDRGMGTLALADRVRLFHLSLAIEASLIAYLVAGIFHTALYHPNFWTLTAFGVALKGITRRARAHGADVTDDAT